AADRDAHQQATYHHKERKLREAQDVLRAQKKKLLVSAPLQQILTVRKGLIKKSYAVDMKNVCAITVTDFGIGLRPDLLLEEKAYHMKVEQKPATSLWQRCMDDFIAYCSGFMNPDKPHEQRKIELAQRIMADDSRVRIGDYLDVLYKAPRATIKQLITALDAPMGDFPAKVRQQVQDAVLTDLETTLQSRPKDKRNATLERVVRRFKPTHYDEKFTPHKTYVVHRCREPSILKAAAKATGSSCIRDQDLNAFADMIADVGTLFFVGLEERKVMGYMRLFVFKDKEKNIVLGVDTFEPPAKDFETHIDIVNAFGLAAVTFCLDIGAKYVVANDGRIKYGPRAAFSNTEKSVHLTKLGRTPPRNQYTFVVDEHGAYQGTPYVLIENWRV
ncbi:hypothetical protein HY639_02555, partial [Candidatus Woesearchaeota archaeon]|nr:hypothetical protein [Candidatus Woesearchaeota archaeon]